jgi:anti-sigma factor (TIGR02949 family)
MDKLTCEEVFRRLDDYVDRELSTDEIKLVEEHLALCAHCAAEYRFEQSFITDVRDKVQRITCPSDLMANISRTLSGVTGEE